MKGSNRFWLAVIMALHVWGAYMVYLYVDTPCNKISELEIAITTVASGIFIVEGFALVIILVLVIAYFLNQVLYKFNKYLDREL